MRIKPKSLAINGFFLLDKPHGITSNHALQKTKWLFNAQKAGHTGSLDPLATGMLPICFGEATKFARFIIEADKSYTVEACLGIATQTSDCEGEVVSTKPVTELLSETTLKEILTKFSGKQQQVPSMFSAIKYKGKPLYEYARRGKTVEREPRDIEIYNLNILDQQLTANNTLTLKLEVECTKGTYIRTLVEDIGNFLGVGAHVSALRRNWVAPFNKLPAVDIKVIQEAARTSYAANLTEQYLLPINTGLKSLPQVELNDEAVLFLRQGQYVSLKQVPKIGWVVLLDKSQEFIGVGQSLGNGSIAPKRMLSQASDTLLPA